MAEQNPPYTLQAAGSNHTAKLFRRVLEGLLRNQGVGSLNGSNDMKVTQNGSGSVDVDRGGGFIVGDEVTNQGIYFVYNDGTVNLSVPAAASGKTRIDRIIAEVHDVTEGHTQDAAEVPQLTADTWGLVRVPGTEVTSGPTAPALPNSALNLATVTVTDTGITTVTDIRTLFRLTSASQTASTLNDEGTTTATSYSTALTGSTSPSVTVDIPATGRVMVTFSCKMKSNGASTRTFASVDISGANTISATESRGVSVTGDGFWAVDSTQVYTGLSEGNTTFQMAFKVGTGTSTIDDMRIAVVPLLS